MNIHRLPVLVFVLLAAELSQATDAVGVATSFVERLGRPATFQEVTVSGDGLRTTCIGPDYMVVATANDVVLWSDQKPFAGVRPPSTLTIDEAWVRAETWAAAASIKLPVRDKAQTDGFSSSVTLRFKDRPDGFVAKVGNLATIDVDLETGQVLTMQQVTGITYDRPKRLIAKDQAAKAVRERIVQVYGIADPAIVVGNLQYVTSKTISDGGLADPNRPDLWKSRRSRLAYEVSATSTFDGKSATTSLAAVDAETGLVLSWNGIDKSAAPLRVENGYGPWALLVASASFGGALYWGLKRRLLTSR